MQQTDDEALRSIDTYLHDLYYCIREIPGLRELADRIGVLTFNYAQYRNIDPKKITFGSILWAPQSGMWKVEPLQVDDQASTLILPPEFNQIKDVIEDLPEVARLIQAIGGQLMPRVRAHRLKGRKIVFTKAVWLPDNSIIFKAYRKLDSGRLDTIYPEMVVLN